MYKRQMLYFLILVKKAKKHILLSILLIRLITPSYGQGTFEESPFVNMIFKIDTSVYTWEENAMMINGEMQLPFYYDSENEMAEVEMKLAEHADAAAIQLKFSNDYIHKAHHWLILHGRYTCLSRKPKCQICPLTGVCRYYTKNYKF